MQNTSAKAIDIGLLTYAMFDKDNGYDTRFVDLNPMTDLLEYIRVVHEYNRYGTIHSYFDKVTDRDDVDELSRKARQTMKRLSDIISFNDISGFRTVVRNCHELAAQAGSGQDTNVRIRLLSDHIFSDIDRVFWPILEDDCLLQFELAIWHFNRKRFLVAATTAVECAISFAAELAGRRNADYEKRTEISRLLSYRGSTGGNREVRRLKEAYNAVRMNRNELAHPSGTYQDNQDLFRDLQKNLQAIRDIYRTSFSDPTNHSGNREALRSTLCPDSKQGGSQDDH